MPSWPDIPIPTSAAWIMLTSFAPSPGVGRQEGTLTVQERVPPSEEGNNLSWLFQIFCITGHLDQENWHMASSTTSRLWSWSPSFPGDLAPLGQNPALGPAGWWHSNPNTIYITIILCFCMAKSICSGTCFAAPYFTEFSESMTNLIADDNVTSQFQEFFCSFQLTGIC